MLHTFKRWLGRLNAVPAKPSPQPDAPLQRWSIDTLKEVKDQLESKDLKQWTVEDNLQAVEFLHQRYLPQDEPITEAQWQVRRANFQEKIEDNIRKDELGISEEPSWIKANRVIDHRRQQLQSSYFASKSDFLKIIIPALAKFPFASDIEGISSKEVNLLWKASASYDADTPLRQRYAIQDAKDALMDRFSPSVLDTSTALRRNYEVLRRAANAGCLTVKLSVERDCRCFGDVLDGTHVQTADALAAFEDSRFEKPLLPPYQAACANCEDPRICRVTLLPVEPPNDVDGNFDPAFQAWLDEKTGRGRPMLPADWRPRIERHVLG